MVRVALVIQVILCYSSCVCSREINGVHARFNETHVPELAHYLDLMVINVLAILRQTRNGDYFFAIFNCANYCPSAAMRHNDIAGVHFRAKSLTVQKGLMTDMYWDIGACTSLSKATPANNTSRNQVVNCPNQSIKLKLLGANRYKYHKLTPLSIRRQQNEPPDTRKASSPTGRKNDPRIYSIACPS